VGHVFRYGWQCRFLVILTNCPRLPQGLRRCGSRPGAADIALVPDFAEEQHALGLCGIEHRRPCCCPAKASPTTRRCGRRFSLTLRRDRPSNGCSRSTSSNCRGRSSATDVCATRFSKPKAIEAALRRIDMIWIAPEFEDKAESYTLQNALSWRMDPMAATEIDARLATYGFDKHAINTEVYVQAREIFVLFEGLLSLPWRLRA
jgi:hypothetical protein